MLGEFWHVVSDQISLKSWVFAPMLLSRPTEFWGGTTSRPVGVRRGRGEKGKEFGRAFNRIQRPVHSGILRLIRTWRSGGWCCVEGVEKEEVSEVYMGNVIQTSLGQNPARQAALFAGTLSDSICSMPACTIPLHLTLQSSESSGFIFNYEHYLFSPLTSTWPQLRCDVGLEEGEYWKKTVSVL